MFERILERMRKLAREGHYVVTVHAVEAMEDDELTVFDVERCLLSAIVSAVNGSTWWGGQPWTAPLWSSSPRLAGRAGS
ncbi:MAG: hypothetical protein HYU26_00980 [Candidatus Rokubacteria bacterium]|nr:hypothetical protein [Candidatus Rokubacteria bacterium]